MWLQINVHQMNFIEVYEERATLKLNWTCLDCSDSRNPKPY